jgi:tetratricopeptide (TPR) repeat protein
VHTLQAEVYLLKKDTVKAVASLEKSISVDAYDGTTWGMKAAVHLGRSEWKDAEEALDKAIHLKPKHAGYHINRALAKVNQQNLRGAMEDYDTALDFEPNNFLGHYNRGLLRSQVGDDNRAIEDFDFVIKIEPDNMMALFNRAILLQNTGDIRKAIADYSKVIEHYPDFWTGLHKRAECYRMLGMNKEAELDEFRVYKAQMDKRYGSVTKKRDNKTRKRSDDADMDKYNQLVVADEQEFEHQYDNDYRGKVQNRRVSEEFMDMYELSFENNNNKIGTYIAYDRQVDSLNNINRKDRVIHIIATHKTLDETKSKAYFTYIDTLSSDINNHALLKRAIAYTAVQDYESAVSDLTQYLSVDSTSAIAYWVRGVCRSKLNRFDASLGANVGMKTVNVISDFTEGIKCNPSNAYLYYNRANVYVQRKDYESAISDYTKALEIDSNLPEAYYNRGMAFIHSGKKTEGIADLSKAGELGLYTAYSVLKKYNK